MRAKFLFYKNGVLVLEFLPYVYTSKTGCEHTVGEGKNSARQEEEFMELSTLMALWTCTSGFQRHMKRMSVVYSPQSNIILLWQRKLADIVAFTIYF